MVASIPFHLLSMVYAPKTVIVSLNRILSSFYGGHPLVNLEENGFLGIKCVGRLLKEVWVFVSLKICRSLFL